MDGLLIKREKSKTRQVALSLKNALHFALSHLSEKLILFVLTINDKLIKIVLTKQCLNHCVESVRIRSYSGTHFPAFGLNTGR